MTPCIVLASVLKEGHKPQDLFDFQNDYHAFHPGPLLEKPFVIELRKSGSQDGGNGGGGEPGGAPMRPEISPSGRSFWDFKTYPSQENSKDKKFPATMRFEVCLRFDDIREAMEFLALRSAGQRIRRLFTYVEVVALSQPTQK